MWTRKELKLRAKDGLNRNYWKAVLISAIFTLVFSGGSILTFKSDKLDDIVEYAFENNPFLVIFAGFFGLVFFALFFILIVFLINPFKVGVCKFRTNALNGCANIADTALGYDVSYKRNVNTLFFMDLFIGLWSLLFVVPGIVKYYEYSMIPYILADDPNISRKEAFMKSKKLMSGNKWRAFVLTLSFIPWYILGALTFGVVSLFYVQPYQQLTSAALYEELKKTCL